MTDPDLVGLCERLRATHRDRSDPKRPRFLANPEGPQAASAIERLIAERDEARDKAEGLAADLRCAVQTAYNRGATEWARLNYRSMIPWLESQASKP